MGLLLPPLGDYEGQDEQNPLGGIPINGVNGSVGVTMEIACCQSIAQNSAQESASAKKLLNYNLDLKPLPQGRQKKEAMRAE